MQTKGLFITLEGGEGVGKSTQHAMLLRRVRGAGREAIATREPGGTNLGSGLRRLLESGGHDPAPMAELLMFMADRAQHIARVIAPAMEAGQVVICDRFADSSEVYQGRVRGLDLDWVRQLNKKICGDLWPQLTIVLDLDPRTGLNRVQARQDELGQETTRFEQEDLEFHRQVRQGFLDQAAAEPARIKVLDASAPAEDVADQIWSYVEPLLKEATP